MKVMKATPAMALAVLLPVLAFVGALVRPGVGAVLQANGVIICSVTLLLIGWWAGALIARAKGTMIDTALGGLGVGVTHAIAAVVLFGYVAGMPIAILLDQYILMAIVAIVGAVAGSGIMK